MATYTTNYQLHQWEASDDFLRTDFNTDFQKIDAAIKRVETTLSAAIAGKSAAVGGMSPSARPRRASPALQR